MKTPARVVVVGEGVVGVMNLSDTSRAFREN